jgi:predicted transcriptional regulator
MSELEKWFVKILKVKNKQGIKCEITLYMRGKTKKYMFMVDGEPRNIEKYLNPDELIEYKALLKKKPTPCHT